jgi:hypothetical protein
MSENLLDYHGISGYLRLGLLKARSAVAIYGLLKAATVFAPKVLSLQLLYRMEGKLSDVAKSSAPHQGLTFEGISTLERFLKWNHQSDLEDLRGLYGIVQAKLRLSRGYVLSCAYSGESLAGFLWLAPHDSSEAGYRTEVSEGYCIDGFTFPEHRGKGALPNLFKFLATTIAATNPSVDRIVAHCGVSNRASVAGQKKAGLKIAALELSLMALSFHRKLRMKTYPSELIQHPPRHVADE